MPLLEIKLTYRHWTINFGIFWLALSLLAIGLFSSLGIWQLQRYEDKQAWLQEQPELDFHGVFLDSFVIYLDNKIMHSTPGYEIFQGFAYHTPSGQKEIALVSRGWIAQPKNAQNHDDRSVLPEILTPQIDTPLTPIHIKTKTIPTTQSKYGITYTETNINKNPDNSKITLRISRLDIPDIQKSLDQQGLKIKLNTSYYLSLEKYSGYQLTPLPEPQAWLNPHKHLGYAVQWFAFGLITLFLYIRFGCRLIKTSTKKSSKLRAGKID